MEYLIGQMVGGLILMTVLTRGALWALRNHRSPGTIVMIHVGAWVFGIVLYGWGNADGGPWDPADAWLIYGVPATLLCGLALYGDKRREKPRYDRIPGQFD